MYGLPQADYHLSTARQYVRYKRGHQDQAGAWVCLRRRALSDKVSVSGCGSVLGEPHLLLPGCGLGAPPSQQRQWAPHRHAGSTPHADGAQAKLEMALFLIKFRRGGAPHSSSLDGTFRGLMFLLQSLSTLTLLISATNASAL